ncbi:OLC1v1024432C1 [Oldenlandia corymbosa var. corymbosa]|uniref:OLC1v1024432C1 n=1 Tax=Oldenlandia corymbosa var. corymbosa TaxID=529605 RepID=A0AAV1C327_OLDCO|nr:OLC1v1024432C1 [Oldenlandia corymbosa var. corymbosa]
MHAKISGATPGKYEESTIVKMVILGIEDFKLKLAVTPHPIRSLTQLMEVVHNTEKVIRAKRESKPMKPKSWFNKEPVVEINNVSWSSSDDEDRPWDSVNAVEIIDLKEYTCEALRMLVVSHVYSQGISSSGTVKTSDTVASAKVYSFDITQQEAIFDDMMKTGHVRYKKGYWPLEPSEIAGKTYCKYHISWTHCTNDCVVFCNYLQKMIDEGKIKVDDPVDMNINPFPTEHPVRMINVGLNSHIPVACNTIVCMHCDAVLSGFKHQLMELEQRFGGHYHQPIPRQEVTIMVDGHLQTWPNDTAATHIRPLFICATTDGVPLWVLVDNGAAINILPFSAMFMDDASLDIELAQAVKKRDAIERVLKFFADERKFKAEHPEVNWEDMIYDADLETDSDAIELNELAIVVDKLEDGSVATKDLLITVDLALGDELKSHFGTITFTNAMVQFASDYIPAVDPSWWYDTVKFHFPAYHEQALVPTNTVQPQVDVGDWRHPSIQFLLNPDVPTDIQTRRRATQYIVLDGALYRQLLGTVLALPSSLLPVLLVLPPILLLEPQWQLPVPPEFSLSSQHPDVPWLNGSSGSSLPRMVSSACFSDWWYFAWTYSALIFDNPCSSLMAAPTDCAALPLVLTTAVVSSILWNKRCCNSSIVRIAGVTLVCLALFCDVLEPGCRLGGRETCCSQLRLRQLDSLQQVQARFRVHKFIVKKMTPMQHPPHPSLHHRSTDRSLNNTQVNNSNLRNNPDHSSPISSRPELVDGNNKSPSTDDGGSSKGNHAQEKSKKRKSTAIEIHAVRKTFMYVSKLEKYVDLRKQVMEAQVEEGCNCRRNEDELYFEVCGGEKNKKIYGLGSQAACYYPLIECAMDKWRSGMELFCKQNGLQMPNFDADDDESLQGSKGVENGPSSNASHSNYSSINDDDQNLD